MLSKKKKDKHKGLMLGFYLYETLGKAKLQRQKVNQRVPWGQRWGSGLTANGHKGTFKGGGNVLSSSRKWLHSYIQ